jgi:hypothetical protein
MQLLFTATPTDWPGVVLACLNVVQTIALAYLAADRHAVRAARSQGLGTRVGDRDPTERGAG